MDVHDRRLVDNDLTRRLDTLAPRTAGAGEIRPMSTIEAFRFVGRKPIRRGNVHRVKPRCLWRDSDREQR